MTVPLIEQYKSDISNYANDTPPYNYGNTFLEAISNLETTIYNLLIGFATIISKQISQNVIYLYNLLT